MAEADETADGEQGDAPKKSRVKGLVIGIVLAIALGGGGFFAVYSGLILGPHEAGVAAAGGHEAALEALQPVAFVPLEPLVISLGAGEQGRHLRFRAELEVTPEAQSEVAELAPRIMDVLNSYLRAVEVSDLEDRSALISLRAQMLRRIQIVTGAGRVRDLLIMEFVLN